MHKFMVSSALEVPIPKVGGGGGGKSSSSNCPDLSL